VKIFRTVVAVVATLAIGGCATASQTGQGAAGAGFSDRVSETKHPSDLVGVWRVTGEPGESGDSWLRFDAHAVTVWRDCGIVEGSWRANGELFVADTYLTYGEGCLVPDAIAVDWLNRVRGYTTTDHGIELADANGAAVTTLVDDGSRPPSNPYNTATVGDPELTAETVSELEPGLPLPAGVNPATDIVGRWIAADATSTAPEEPYVEFHADGSYTTTEGCNLTGGRWALGHDADFLATVGISTDMACDMIDIPAWVGSASSIGAEHRESGETVLTLYGAGGDPLGHLESAAAVQ
jgi:hypothetical protein